MENKENSKQGTEGQTCLNCVFLNQCRAFAYGYNKPFRIIRDCPEWQERIRPEKNQNI